MNIAQFLKSQQNKEYILYYIMRRYLLVIFCGHFEEGILSLYLKAILCYTSASIHSIHLNWTRLFFFFFFSFFSITIMTSERAIELWNCLIVSIITSIILIRDNF